MRLLVCWQAIEANGRQLGLVPIEVNKLVTNKLDYQIMENMNEKAETKALSQIAVMPRCSTCKYWKQTTFYDYNGAENDGDCSEIGGEIVIELKTGWNGGYVDNIETKSTFGCVLHNEA